MLWEGRPDDPGQIRAREEVLDSLFTILTQVELWTHAAEQSKRPKSQPVEISETGQTDEDVEMSMGT